MLFIENYDAKSLDRSSVSMIDKYNGRLGIVGMLLTKLSALIDNLLSLIRDIRNTLGKCKQRVYDNLNQVKKVISGNNIKGTDSTVQAIEDALKAGDEAIAKAESTLQGVQKEMECNEEPGVETQPEGDCGEIPNEVPSETTDCNYCDVTTQIVGETGIQTTTCQINVDSQIDISCNEPVSSKPGIIESLPSKYDGCTLTIIDSGGTITLTNGKCGETITMGGPTTPKENCTFTCQHSTPCHEAPMPHNCTYSCVDAGCNYQGNDCAYGTICNMSCDQPASEIAACGNCGQGYGCGDWSEFCGEVGGGSTSKGDEGCGDCGDCGNCGEGEGCGDWSEFCGE